MTEDQIVLIQASFANCAPQSEVFTRLFYRRLFEVAPEVRSLFSGDMDTQGQKLMHMLSVVVDNLNDLERVIPATRDLAVRHAGYGVLPEHYPLVGEALIMALKTTLGEAFTPQAEEAWAEAYLLLASTMISAAKAA